MSFKEEGDFLPLLLFLLYCYLFYYSNPSSATP